MKKKKTYQPCNSLSQSNLTASSQTTQSYASSSSSSILLLLLLFFSSIPWYRQIEIVEKMINGSMANYKT